MFVEVVKAKYIKDYQIELTFNDGKNGIIDLKDHLTGEIFKPLRDKSFLKKFKIEFDTLSWKNGAGIAPEFLYSKVTGKPFSEWENTLF